MARRIDLLALQEMIMGAQPRIQSFRINGDAKYSADTSRTLEQATDGRHRSRCDRYDPLQKVAIEDCRDDPQAKLLACLSCIRRHNSK